MSPTRRANLPCPRLGAWRVARMVGSPRYIVAARVLEPAPGGAGHGLGLASTIGLVGQSGIRQAG
jgi:hypothetical protein